MEIYAKIMKTKPELLEQIRMERNLLDKVAWLELRREGRGEKTVIESSNK